MAARIKRFFSSISEGMKLFGSDVAGIVNTVLLTAVYIIGVGVTSIIAKISGKHFLDKEPKGKTYWKDTKNSDSIDSHYRQF